MVDLVLVQPPDTVLLDPEMYFPLGILYIAAVVKGEGYSVEIMDFRKRIDEIPEARFYGFSCCTPHIGIAKKLAQTVRGKTIVGGAHATLLPDDCIDSFDYVVRGEGEDVIRYIMRGDVPKGIVKARRIGNLDKLPHPAWDMVEKPFSNTLFPGERYGMGAIAGTIMASRGCSYNCGMCGNTFKSPVTFRSVSHIMSELIELMKRGVYYFRFEDDNMTIHPEFRYLCHSIKQLGIKYKCHTRSNLLTLDMAMALKDSGCEECGIGVESADDKVLKIVNKKVTAEQHLQAVRTLKEAGLRSKTYFVTGLPGETDETIELNKKFMLEAKPDKWTVSTFTPYPGSPIHDNPEKYGIEIVNRDYGKWWNFCENEYNHILKGQTPQEMWARYKDFYGWLIDAKYL